MSTRTDSPPVRRLTVADLADVVEIQKGVTDGLPVGFIRSRTESELRAYLDGTLGVAYGVVDGTALLAMSLLRIPDENHPNRTSLPFPRVPERDWPLRACLLENTLVLPTARGRGYQRALLAVRVSHAASARMKWICAGVQLQNSVSWANLLAIGMAIVGIRLILATQSSDCCARSIRWRCGPIRAIRYRSMRTTTLDITPHCETDTSAYVWRPTER